MDGIARKLSECNCLNLGKIPEGDGLYQVIKPKGELDKAFVHSRLKYGNHTTLPLLHFKAFDDPDLLWMSGMFCSPAAMRRHRKLPAKRALTSLPPCVPRQPRSLANSLFQPCG